ncbi:SDR family NAD(P)-dependent oxidoreductase [Haloactinomyces albus]|uniref:NAD(P)-dependent dehydrogenase (Short-subunit alcohol dehydrogenase family) n=1 Tax=Haloactinomyces albus TaxID=1352928 RepID=A0AAE4CN00_9ACTN|nr:glucose 1-dehydrogenase [Haloactinomyces albus]MDR7303970.1 NAD(P)-dependent dehydrogenase (short-subunit alcohol dehydrogenase family) [Haloactinomyces albus]
MARLQNRIALVTGAASGIGEAASMRLAEEGASVLVSDIRKEAGEEVAARIRGKGGQAVFARHDVADEASWEAVVGRVIEEFGGLDILVNNAGVGDMATIEETTKEQYDHVVAVTQTSVFLGMRASADLLKASARAAVVNISSIFGAIGGFGTSPSYHAAKGAVRILTKNIALNWTDSGVRVNSVHPGFVDTPSLESVKGTELEAGMTQLTPMGRLGKPFEVAAAVAFLASDDASFITGSELYVDGGYMAR